MVQWTTESNKYRQEGNETQVPKDILLPMTTDNYMHMMEGNDTQVPEDVLLPWTNESNTYMMEGNFTQVPDPPPFLLILMPTLSTWTIIANLFVVIVVLTNKNSRRDPHMMVITSLALSDACVGLSTVWFTILLTNPTGLLQKPMVCSAVFQAFFSSVFSSSIHIVLICVERITAITKPHKFKKLFTLKRNRIYSIGIWLFSFAVSSVLPILWLREEDYALSEICAARTVYLPENIGISYPTVCMIVLYSLAAPVFGFLLFKMRQRFKILPRPCIQIASIPMNTDPRNTFDAQPQTAARGRIDASGENIGASKCIASPGSSIHIDNVPTNTDPCNTVGEQLQTEAHDHNREDYPSDNIPASTLMQSPGIGAKLDNVNVKRDPRNTTAEQPRTDAHGIMDAPNEIIPSQPRTDAHGRMDAPNEIIPSQPRTDAHGRMDAPNEIIPSRKLPRVAKRSDGGKLKTVVILFALLTLTSLPNGLGFLIGAILDDLVSQQYAFLLGYLWVLNSSINPFVYAVTNDKFKQTMCNVFRLFRDILRR